MIEKYFKLGIRYSWDKPANVDGARDGEIVPSVRPPKPLTYIGLADVVDPVLLTSHVSSLGLQMRMAIPYQWLDYTPGRTSKIKLGDGDVLTGFMSGCIIARWQEAGVTYVGHVGTVESDPLVNKKVKDKCKETLTGSSFNSLGFNPAKVWDLTELMKIMQDFKVMNPPQICALVTSAGEFYSFAMVKESASDWICGGAKLVAPSQLSQLL